MVPGQAGAAVQQRGLVGLDREQVVGPLAGDQELGGVGVGVQRIGGDHGASQVQVAQQRDQARDFTRGAVDVALGEHDTGDMVHRCEQVDLPAVVAFGAPQRLAVDRDRPPSMLLAGSPGRSRSASHAPITAASAVGSTRARVRRMVVSVGTAQWSGASRRAPNAARTGWGASEAHSAIAAIDRAPVKTAAAAMARIVTKGWRRPLARLESWIVAR